MPLDFLEQNKINIKDLTLETPKREETFESMIGVTPEEWTEIKDEINRSLERQDLGIYQGPSLLSAVSILYPGESTRDLSEARIWERANNKLSENINHGIFDASIGIVSNLKLLYPDRVHELIVEEDTWQKALEDLNDKRDKKFHLQYAYMLHDMLIACPERSAELNLDVNVWRFLMDGISRWRERTDSDSATFSFLATLRVLFPDSYNNFGINEESAFESAGSYLKFYRQEKKWDEFVALAFNLKILEAEKVEVTKEGLIIGPSKPRHNLITPVSNLPEVRKF